MVGLDLAAGGVAVVGAVPQGLPPPARGDFVDALMNVVWPLVTAAGGGQPIRYRTAASPDPDVDAAIVPGTYDLIYEREYWNGDSSHLPYVSRVHRGSVYPNANTRLRSCIAVP